MGRFFVVHVRGRRSIKGGKSSLRECLQAFSPLPPLVSSRFFFLREFFSRALLSERLEQANFSQANSFVGLSLTSRREPWNEVVFQAYPQEYGLVKKAMENYIK